MNPQTQARTSAPAQTGQTAQQTDYQRLLAQQAKSVEYKPFGQEDSIRLTVKMVIDDIAVKSKNGHTCTEQDARRFIMLCQAQRLNPWAGDAYAISFDGQDGVKTSLITAHQVFLKRAETSADFDGFESGIIILKEDGEITEREGDFSVKGENVVGGWCKVYRRGRSHPTYKRLSIEQRKPPYNTPFWQGVKAHEQIVKCAEADALRATFPNLLGGLYTQGEVDIDRIVAETMKNAFGMNVKPEASPKSETVIPLPVAKPTEDFPPGLEPSSPVIPETGDPKPQASPEPTPAAPAASPSAARTAQEKLAEIVTGAGYSFDDFVKFVGREQLVKDAQSLGGFEDVQNNEAARLLRAEKGLLAGLKGIKEGA